MPTQMFTEPLESRTLMSVTLPPAFNAAVKADRLQVQADLLKFRSDAVSGWLTLSNDLSAVKADQLKKATNVVPLIKQLRSDVATMRMTLLEDRLAEKSNVLADESVIATDERQKLLDHGNPTALAADKTKLRADRIQVQNDEIAGLNSRIATRSAAEMTIFNDGNAIVMAAKADANASPQLVTDLQKFVTDRSTLNITLVSDLQKVVADRQKLVVDLTALQST